MKKKLLKGLTKSQLRTAAASLDINKAEKINREKLINLLMEKPYKSIINAL